MSIRCALIKFPYKRQIVPSAFGDFPPAHGCIPLLPTLVPVLPLLFDQQLLKRVQEISSCASPSFSTVLSSRRLSRRSPASQSPPPAFHLLYFVVLNCTHTRESLEEEKERFLRNAASSADPCRHSRVQKRGARKKSGRIEGLSKGG